MKITTRYGNSYIINANMQVERTDMNFTPSDTWKFTGFYMRKAFGNLQYFSIPDMVSYIEQGGTLSFKNGKPKFTWGDIDHGTHRIHGNIDCHGIRYITF